MKKVLGYDAYWVMFSHGNPLTGIWSHILIPTMCYDMQRKIKTTLTPNEIPVVLIQPLQERFLLFTGQTIKHIVEPQ